MPEEGLSRQQKRTLAAIEVWHPPRVVACGSPCVAQGSSCTWPMLPHCSCESETCAPQEKEARKDREAAISKAEMAAAPSRGASWGMSEDAGAGAEEGSEEVVDWRSYSATHVSTLGSC